MKSALALFLCAAALAGCVTPQTEDPRGAPLEAASLGLKGRPLPLVADQWWEQFGDAQLNRIAADALRNSPSLAQALARIRAAQAQSMAAGAETRPSIALDADETRQRFSENSYFPPPFGGHTFWNGGMQVNLGWDLDFWGRQAALIEQSKSAELASELDFASARLALAGAIAQAYVDLDRAWKLHDIAERNLAQREELLRLTQRRVDTGLDTQVELKIAQALVPQARNALLQAESARDLAVHRLAALAGYGADRYAQIQRPTANLEAALKLPDELPVDLLARRPDLLAARIRVEAAMSGRSAARAAFYPDINLRAFIGLQAIGLDNLFKGSSMVAGIGPALHLPIFEAQRLRAGYKSATAEVDTAIADYNAAVLEAVRQSADQLTLSDSYRKQIGDARQSLDASTTAHNLAQRRYSAGLTTQLVVLNAETQMLDAQRELANLNASLAVARVSLLLTLGGSFDPARPVNTANGASL